MLRIPCSVHNPVPAVMPRPFVNQHRVRKLLRALRYCEACSAETQIENRHVLSVLAEQILFLVKFPSEPDYTLVVRTYTRS